jgi:hypothetical protein
MIIEACRFHNGARRLQQMALKANGIVIVLRTKLLIVGDSVMDCFVQASGDGDASPGAVL